jgi:plasmid stabilization system protein ParE
MRLRLSEQAEQDLKAQIDWLEDISPRTSMTALDRILNIFDLLENNPEMGAQTDRGWRETSVQFGRDGYVICYVIRPADIFVVRLFHSRQNRD